MCTTWRRDGGVAFDEFGGDFAEPNGERRGLEDVRVRAPAQDPSLDFFKAAQAHPQVRAAAGEFRHDLSGMPLPAPQLVGGPGVEFDDDFIIPLALHHAEAGAQIFIGIEGGWLFKSLIGEDRRTDATESEGADVGSISIVAEEIPAILAAGEVVGVDFPELQFLLARLS